MIQQGGSGDSKQRKRLQYGGGWAKHAYGDLHPLSNRRERAVRHRGDLDDPADRHRAFRSRKKKIPSRKHLMDRLEAVERNILSHKDRIKRYPPKPAVHPNEWDGLKWAEEHMTALVKDRNKILSEFEKHGYKLP